VYTVVFIPKTLNGITVSLDPTFSAPRVGARSDVQDVPWVDSAAGWTALPRVEDPSKVAKNNKAVPFK
jgi:hypothetical protein